ncbi:MAG: DUF3299 domain-containing protein [Alphaproteobacteria bacterium]|nr:DUF3299 domain-containing protein [Alphaproteobacteria bacterium]
MTHGPVFAVALAAIILSGCGQADRADAASEPETKLLQAQSDVTQPRTPAQPSDGPSVGERIAEPGGQSAGSDNDLTSEPVEYSRDGVRVLGWEELMPEGEEERLAQMYQQQMQTLYSDGPIAEGSAADKMVQIGTFNTVGELDGKKVRLPGYTVPFEYGPDAEVDEFLLVPYFGACIHAPPPPPNQTVFVMTDEPLTLKDLAQAVWIEGTIHASTQESELADAAYTFELEEIEVYEY